MPIYEYVCEDCSTRHERLVLSSATNGNGIQNRLACPKCGSQRQSVQFSVFATFAPNGTSSNGKSASETGCGCTPRTCGCH